jgi:hypothetical protein
MKLTRSQLKEIIREELQSINEAKRLTAQHAANIIKNALQREGYFGKRYVKNAIVYKDDKDFKTNQNNSWGGYSGDQIPLKMGVVKYSKPNAVFDIFIYNRGFFGDYGDLESNVVVHLPLDKEEQMVQSMRGEYMPISLAIKKYGNKNYPKL